MSPSLSLQLCKFVGHNTNSISKFAMSLWLINFIVFYFSVAVAKFLVNLVDYSFNFALMH